MWQQKIGISLGNGYELPTPELVKLVARIGFDAISPEWEENADLDAIVDAAHSCGLAVQSLHAPYHGAAKLWSENEAESGPALNQILRALEDCARFRIPVLVLHTWIGFEYSFHKEGLFFGNYERIVAAARQKSIRVAFENTEGEEYLFALMDHFSGDETVGFCWDSGHEMCYNHFEDLLSRFGDRLLVTHLNDNLGISRFDGKVFWTDDLHLLPYDGIADWDRNLRRLKAARPQEYLNFELSHRSKPNRHENDKYTRMTPQEFFTEAYIRACRIANRYAR